MPPALGTIKIIVAVAGSAALLTSLVIFYHNWKKDVIAGAAAKTAAEHVEIAIDQKEDIANRPSLNDDFIKILQEGKM